MYSTDKELLLCDMAETYHIFDLQGLPVKTLAALAFGLGQNSRVRRKLAGVPVSMETLLLGHIADRLGLLLWFQTEDGERNVNRPRSFVEILLGEGAKTKTNSEETVAAFDSPEDFEAARAKFQGRC